MSRRLFVLSLLLAALFIAASFSALADTQYYDFSADQQSYGQQVARMNLSREAGAAKVRSLKTSASLVLVLCKTDGTSVDFSALNASGVICGPGNRYTLVFSSTADADNAVETLRDMTCVLYAERDQDVSACEAEDVPSFRSWGAEAMEFGPLTTYVQRLGTVTRTVAVVDSGVYRHSLLQGRIKTLGYDYVDADDDPTNDLFGHGTHVAGIIADCTQGLDIRIYPVRTLDGSGHGTVSNNVNGIIEAADAGADVINLSFTMNGISEALDDAVHYALSKGVTVVVAAGNSSANAASYSPACLTDHGVIVVGAAERNGEAWSRASYSNYGSSVDVYAAGTDIQSCSRTGGYVSKSGTSQAAPHIAAACALLSCIHPEISAAEMEERLVASSPVAGIQIPLASSFSPCDYGFSLKTLTVGMNDSVRLMNRMLPLISDIPVYFMSEDESVLTIDENGILCPHHAGQSMVTAGAPGVENEQFLVYVTDDPLTEVLLPASLLKIEDEAFTGDDRLERVRIPNELRTIGTAVFSECKNLVYLDIPSSVVEIGSSLLDDSPNAVAICRPDSYAHQYLLDHQYAFLCTEENPITEVRE